VEAASSGRDGPRGSSLPHRHGYNDRVRAIHVQLAVEHHQDRRLGAFAVDLTQAGCRATEA
jgi:hypothetical protein